MADKKLTELPIITSPTGTYVYVVDPNFGVTGSFAILNDNLFKYFSDEATMTTPTTGTFTTFHSGNGGAGTIANLSNNLGVRLASTIPAGNNNSLTYGVVAISIGTNGWQATARLRRHMPLVSWGMMGMIMRDDVGGKSVNYWLGNDTVIGFNRNQFANDDTWNEVLSMTAWSELNFWMRIKDDKTYWYLYISKDGDFWQQVYREDHNDYMTPTQIGIAINPNFNGGSGRVITGTPVAMDCFSFLFEKL